MTGSSRLQAGWQRWLKGWQQTDWILLLVPTVLIAFAGVVIASTQLNLEATVYGWNHFILGLMGCVIALWLARTRYEIFLQWQWAIYALVNASLIAVIFVGTSGLGAQRWITLFGFNVQPSEFAKVGLIITLAALLRHPGASTLLGMVRVLMVAAVPWALVFIQPDLGTSLVFGAITLGMLYWANVNPGWLVLMISPLVAAIVFHFSIPIN